jgi:hypothetical protein
MCFGQFISMSCRRAIQAEDQIVVMPGKFFNYGSFTEFIVWRWCARVIVSFFNFCFSIVTPCNLVVPSTSYQTPPQLFSSFTSAPSFTPTGPTQYPTYWNHHHQWNGDQALSGSENEWAQEDAAQHALNLTNWRIKILQV